MKTQPQGVAGRLRQCVRETDTVSRQGGDEFIIVLTGVDSPDEAGRVAAKILDQLDAAFDVDGQQLRTSFSIGIALFPEDGHDPETLMKNADTAMYHAKESGRNTYRFFDERMNVNTLERLQLENGLRQAIGRQELRLAYQAQVDLASGRIIGLEALLRWASEPLGNVPPSRFIPLAEECGLIIPIGDWVLREACRQARQWQDAGLAPVPVGVNLSALQFRRSDIVAGVAAALDESGLDGRWLELELTESLLMESGPDVILTLGRLKALGVRLSIDDFGTGYSSLAYLKRFPVDRLKIDQSFVRDLAQNPDDAVIIRTIIQLGHNLRLEVIAEGTETLEQMDFLRREGCTAAQGYLFSRPHRGQRLGHPGFALGRGPGAPLGIQRHRVGAGLGLDEQRPGRQAHDAVEDPGRNVVADHRPARRHLAGRLQPPLVIEHQHPEPPAQHDAGLGLVGVEVTMGPHVGAGLHRHQHPMRRRLRAVVQVVMGPQAGHVARAGAEFVEQGGV